MHSGGSKTIEELYSFWRRYRICLTSTGSMDIYIWFVYSLCFCASFRVISGGSRGCHRPRTNFFLANCRHVAPTRSVGPSPFSPGKSWIRWTVKKLPKSQGERDPLTLPSLNPQGQTSLSLAHSPERFSPQHITTLSPSTVSQCNHFSNFIKLNFISLLNVWI